MKHFASPFLLISLFVALFGAAADARVTTPAVYDTMAERVVTCVACHGQEGRATNAGYFPRIAGKPAGYLFNQLVNFRDGRRYHAQMTYLVRNLSDAYLREMADYFAQLDLPYPLPQTLNASQALLQRGAELARNGDPAQHIPACASCHGPTLTGVAPAIPGLLGLPKDYLGAQMGAWRVGARRTQSPDCMKDVVHALSPSDAEALYTWLSSQPVPANGKPAHALPKPMPTACGNIQVPVTEAAP